MNGNDIKVIGKTSGKYGKGTKYMDLILTPPVFWLAIVMGIATVALIGGYVGYSLGTNQWVPTGWVLCFLVCLPVAWCTFGATLGATYLGIRSAISHQKSQGGNKDA